MNVSINFSAEIESRLRSQAAAAGQDVESFVRNVVTERLAETLPSPATVRTHGEFMSKLRRIIELHPASPGGIDDSRESIYAGREE